MITLTTPPQVNSVLGGNTPVGYNKLVISPFTMDPVGQAINANVRLTSTTAPTMQPIIGTMRINLTSSELILEVTQIGFFRRIALSGAQITAIQGQMETAQAALESGLITLGVIAGVRTAGV